MNTPKITMTIPAPHRGLQLRITKDANGTITVTLLVKKLTRSLLAFAYGQKELCHVTESDYDGNWSMWVDGTCFEILAGDAKTIAEQTGCEFLSVVRREAFA